MKLVYFDMAGRAEVSRLLCHIGDVKVEDVRMSREQWIGEYKPKAPTGQVPFLELDDGSILSQSTAIACYVAELGNLRPKDPLQRAREIEMAGCLEDVIQAVAPTFQMEAGPEKVKARQELMKKGGKMNDKLMVIDKLLQKSSTKYYLGDEPGMADASCLCTVAHVSGGTIDGIEPSDMDQFPKLQEIAKKLINEPKVKEYYSSKGDVYKGYKALM